MLRSSLRAETASLIFWSPAFSMMPCSKSPVESGLLYFQHFLGAYPQYMVVNFSAYSPIPREIRGTFSPMSFLLLTFKALHLQVEKWSFGPRFLQTALCRVKIGVKYLMVPNSWADASLDIQKNPEEVISEIKFKGTPLALLQKISKQSF